MNQNYLAIQLLNFFKDHQNHHVIVIPNSNKHYDYEKSSILDYEDMQEIQKISQDLIKLKKSSTTPCKSRPRTRVRAHTSLTENRKTYAGKEVMIKTSFSQAPRNLPDISHLQTNSSQITRNVKNVLRRSTKSRLGNIYNGLKFRFTYNWKYSK